MLLEASAALWCTKNPAADCFCSSTAGLVCVCGVCLMYVSFVRHHHSFNALSVLLFKIVVEVACDALVQVYHVVAHHVVAVAGIDKVVGLGAGVLASAEE